MCNESNDNHRVCPTQVFLESCFACGKANNLLTVECSSRSLISHAYSGARERVCVCAAAAAVVAERYWSRYGVSYMLALPI